MLVSLEAVVEEATPTVEVMVLEAAADLVLFLDLGPAQFLNRDRQELVVEDQQ